MDFWTKSVSYGTCVLLVLLGLMLISTHSLPTQQMSGSMQADRSSRERRSTAMDRQLVSELFSRGDLNGDNFLSPSEITNFYEMVIEFPPNLASFMATGFMRNGDNNGDNQLDHDETLTAIMLIEG